MHPQDEEGFDLTIEEDRSRHFIAENGNHLMIPFQCELCHFRNLKGVDPSQRKEVILLIRTIRRANIDVFWLKELGTVKVTVRESWKIEFLRKKLGLDNILSVLTLTLSLTFPLTDTQGCLFCLGR